MARIACQVVQRSKRISFLWSDGLASFEPYHLEADERQHFLKLAGQIHALLAEPSSDASALANLGHQFYRALFRQDASEHGAAAAIQTWFTQLVQSNQIEQLEFLGDDLAAFPWNALIDEPAPGDSWQRFFGTRFNLGVGRRVNPIRQYPALTVATQMLAADPASIAQLSEAQRGRVQVWRDSDSLMQSTAGLIERLKHRSSDIFVVLARFEQGRLHLGDDAFSAADLHGWLQAAEDANPDPVVILMGVGTAADQAGWQAFVSGATCLFNGLIANDVPLPAGQLIDIGLNLAQQFARGQKPIGEELRSLRTSAGAAGLTFSAFCPAQWHTLGAGALPPAAPIATTPLPSEPYHPFAPYDAADRPLFVGREDETIRCAAMLDQSATRGLLLHGSPAVGKTSFLQAGLIPYLEQDNVGYRTLRDRSPLDAPTVEQDYPILLLRCTSDLAGQFADALSVFCAQPLTYTTPTGVVVTVDLPRLLRETVMGLSLPGTTAIQPAASTTGITAAPGEEPDTTGLTPRELWIALRDQKDLLGGVLDAITKPLPFELVIVVDQGEELVTLVRTPQQKIRRQKAIDMLTQLASSSARCKIVYTLRSQNLGQFISLLPDGRTPDDWRTYFLPVLSENKMIDALVWPTLRDEIPYSDEVPFRKYGFAFEDGMAQQIVAEAIDVAAEQQQSPLPILHAVGALLYQKKVVDGRQSVVRMTDVAEVGGAKRALALHLDRSLHRLTIANKSRDALKQLIAQLYTSHADGTLSRDLVLASDLGNYWKKSGEPVEEVVNHAASEEGLFEIQQLLIGGEQQVYVSLPQDSMAQLAKTIEADSLRSLARTRVIDTLWIMIPLMFLAAAVTFFFTRNRTPGDEDGQVMDAKTKKGVQELVDTNTRLRQTFEGMRSPLYAGLLAQADQAMQAGNALRARQLLLSQPALRSFSENRKGAELPDLRGFEWRYLWRNLHSERFLFEGHRSVVTCVAISPDSQWAATGSSHDGSPRTGARDGPIRIWNLAKGGIVAVVGDPKLATTVHALAFAPDGKTLASGGADKTVRLWDVSGLKTDFVEITKEAKSLAGHSDAVHALAFQNASTLASGSADKSVILWDIANATKKKTLTEHTAGVHALAFIDGGKTLVSAGAEAQMLVWDADAGTKRHAIKTPYRTIFALAASDKTLATGGVETKLDADLGMIRFWDIAASKETSPAIQHADGVFALALQPGGKTIASGGKDHIVRLWNVATGKQDRQWLGHLGWVRALAVAKDGGTLVSGSYDSSVKAWNPAQASGPQIINAHADWVQALALYNKNTLLASGSRDGSVKLWDAGSGKLLLALPSVEGAVTSLAFSAHPDKPLLAAGTRDDKNEGHITIWQLENDPKQGWQAKEKYTLKDHRKAVTSLAFYPLIFRPDLLISGSADSTVILWDTTTGKAKETYRGHKDEVRTVAFAPDGKTFASGGKDRQACIYELDQKEFATLPDVQLHAVESIATVAFRRGGQQVTAVIAGGADHSLRIWIDNAGAERVRSEVRAFRSHSQPVSAVLYSERKNGALIVSSSWDGSIKLHDMFDERFTLLGHVGAVRALALASDHSFLASAGNDGTIRIWRAHQERAPTIAEKDKQ